MNWFGPANQLGNPSVGTGTPRQSRGSTA